MKHIEQAPDIPGARKLLPDEPAQAGDRFLYLRSLYAAPENLAFDDLAEVLFGAGFISVGRSLDDSRDAWVAEGSNVDDFDGVIYRPTP